MSEFEIVRSPEIIATEINSLKDQTRSVVLMASVEIGKRLIEAKEKLSHGEWEPWLKINVDYSQTTARNLMKLYNEYGANPQALGDLSYAKAIALVGIAPEEREQFVAENDIENMSSRELQKAIKEKKELEKEIAENAEKEQAASAERENLLKNIEDLKGRLADAENETDGDRAEMEMIESELAAEREKIKQLEKDLKAKPIEAAAVEVIPEEVEKELADLRRKLSEQVDPSDITFRLRFESLVDGFKNMMEALNEVSDSEVRIKYSKAVSGLLNKMDSSLPKPEDIAEKEYERQQVTIFDELVDKK
ncbi:DUF3102 domain-containing protein [Sporosarcina sp. FSL K6-3457]|uniref:DUF3102 domain-containing protein n=1 Tax=Sporosarcina sp. FSL K6-3457 TaxID=2978204 RepID=UPI0030F6987E